MFDLRVISCRNSEWLRIKARIEEGEEKRTTRENLELLLALKINSVWHPKQEL
jgi:SWI/SNF-related matrix-associated actin-dependent regulator of chromatin subfamily A member 5